MPWSCKFAFLRARRRRIRDETVRYDTARPSYTRGGDRSTRRAGHRTSSGRRVPRPAAAARELGHHGAHVGVKEPGTALSGDDGPMIRSARSVACVIVMSGL